jgi:hypothetical protein
MPLRPGLSAIKRIRLCGIDTLGQGIRPGGCAGLSHLRVIPPGRRPIVSEPLAITGIDEET